MCPAYLKIICDFEIIFVRMYFVIVLWTNYKIGVLVDIVYVHVQIDT